MSQKIFSSFNKNKDLRTNFPRTNYLGIHLLRGCYRLRRLLQKTVKNLNLAAALPVWAKIDGINKNERDLFKTNRRWQRWNRAQYTVKGLFQILKNCHTSRSFAR